MFADAGDTSHVDERRGLTRLPLPLHGDHVADPKTTATPVTVQHSMVHVPQNRITFRTRRYYDGPVGDLHDHWWEDLPKRLLKPYLATLRRMFLVNDHVITLGLGGAGACEAREVRQTASEHHDRFGLKGLQVGETREFRYAGSRLPCQPHGVQPGCRQV